MNEIGSGQAIVSSPGVRDLYPTEKNALKNMMARMMRRHSFKGVSSISDEDQIKAAFAEEARKWCAEFGLKIDIEWTWASEQTDAWGDPVAQSPTVSDDPDDHSLYWLPRVVITDRITPESETDHDRVQFEIVHGYDDGTPGYIRPDGSRREDPRKKAIL